MRIHLVSLGCARNQVDSEIMLSRLAEENWEIVDDPQAAEVIVVNTCSFIEPAAEESIDTILELAKFKTAGQCRRLVVAGCLPQRYAPDIEAALPEVDVFLGTGALEEIHRAAGGALDGAGCLLPDPEGTLLEGPARRRFFSGAHAVYLKIAEGCSRRCTYCIIPRLKGRMRSRPPEAILAEARRLVREGAGELILVAQDTTAYGRDLTPATDLGRLLADLANLLPDTWIRVLYGHPASIDEGIIRTMGEHPNICSYFDVPVQHASRRILRHMGRSGSAEELMALFDTIRQRVPDAALRTTAIVGFPGETREDFQALMDFIERIRFDHLGVFLYSDAADLASHHLPGHVAGSVARRRLDRIMTRQAAISLEKNQRYVGRRLKVLLEEQVEEGLFAGRTAFQAPEVDGVTYVRAAAARVGSFVEARITDALEYDLEGEV